MDHPDAREANTQALEDLAGGANGLQVVFSGAVGAHGFGLKRSDPATLAAAFDGVAFDAAPASSSTSVRKVRARRSRSPPICAPPARCPRSAPSRSASIRSAAARARTLSRRLGLPRQALRRCGRRAEGRTLRGSAVRRRRAPGPCGRRLAGAGAGLRARRRRQPHARPRRRRDLTRRRPRHDRVPSCCGRRGIYRDRQIPRAADRLGAGRGGLRSRAPRRPCPGRERLADDDARATPT